MGVRVDYGNPKVSVVFVLTAQGSGPDWTRVGMAHTEYEFSPSCDDPVAKMFGE